TILYDTMAAQGTGDSSIPFAGFFSSTSDGWIMNLVLGSMYLIFPAFWIGMLSWAGARIGAMANHLGQGSKETQNAGAEAGKQAQGLAVNAATGVTKGAVGGLKSYGKGG